MSSGWRFAFFLIALVLAVVASVRPAVQVGRTNIALFPLAFAFFVFVYVWDAGEAVID